MAKKKRTITFVQQHIEKVSWEIFEDTQYRKALKSFIKRQPGIYALYKKDILYYVGLTKDLGKRVNRHVKDRHKGKWNQFSIYSTKSDRSLRELEALCIRIADPKGNRIGGALKKSSNFEKALDAEIGLIDKERRKRLFKSNQKKKGKLKSGRKQKAKWCGKSILAKYNHVAKKLRAVYKGKTYRARVLKNGIISFGRKRYNSPSLAGKAITGCSTNGWLFWEYHHKQKGWRKLNNLRGKK